MSGPSRRERTKPAELVALALVPSVFIGVVVLIATRRLDEAAVAGGVAFVVILVVLAMLALVEGGGQRTDGPVLLPPTPEEAGASEASGTEEPGRSPSSGDGPGSNR